MIEFLDLKNLPCLKILLNYMLLFPIESYYWEQTDNNIRSIDYNKQIS